MKYSLTVCVSLVKEDFISCIFSPPDGASVFPGRQLAQLIVELNALLNTEDIRFFENDM